MLPPTPTQQSISAEVRAEANQAFARGVLVYLYDPQPKTVSRSDLEATEFSLHYILSKDAKAVTNALIILRVNAEGASEPIVPARGYLEDWTSETGVLTFNTFSFARDMIRQQHVDDPNAMVIATFIGMTPLYIGPIQQYVDDPLYLSIGLMAPEESEGILILSASSLQLSNILQIDVTP
jgi:hypothetical protein